MGIITVKRPSISWCRCEYRPLSASGQDQAQVEKECQEETISSVCSGKAERPTNIMQIRVGALKPFHSTSGRPVHKIEMGTLQHQCEGQCRNCYWMQKRHKHRALDIRQNLEPYRCQEGGKKSGIYASKSTG